jgi:hypothetical protein
VRVHGGVLLRVLAAPDVIHELRLLLLSEAEETAVQRQHLLLQTAVSHITQDAATTSMAGRQAGRQTHSQELTG